MTVCDYLIIISASRVSVADELDFVLASRRLLVGARDQSPPDGADVIAATHSGRQTDLLVRLEEPISDASWQVEEPTLEEIVIAYLRRSEASGAPSSDRPETAPRRRAHKQVLR